MIARDSKAGLNQAESTSGLALPTYLILGPSTELSGKGADSSTAHLLCLPLADGAT